MSKLSFLYIYIILQISCNIILDILDKKLPTSKEKERNTTLV